MGELFEKGFDMRICNENMKIINMNELFLMLNKSKKGNYLVLYKFTDVNKIFAFEFDFIIYIIYTVVFNNMI